MIPKRNDFKKKKKEKRKKKKEKRKKKEKKKRIPVQVIPFPEYPNLQVQE